MGLYQKGRPASTFPLCRLHGCRIVDLLPARCPMRAERALTAIHVMLDGAYRDLDTLDADATGALGALERAEICYECVSRRARHPSLRRLRRAKPAPVHKTYSERQTSGNGRKDGPIRLRGRVVA